MGLWVYGSMGLSAGLGPSCDVMSAWFGGVVSRVW